MRWVLFALAALGIGLGSPDAEACGAHALKIVRPPKPDAKADVVPARIAIYGAPMDELAADLSALGHEVSSVATPEALEAVLERGEVDILLAPLSDVRAFLADIRIGMVVPLVKSTDDPMLARDFLFNVSAEPSKLAPHVRTINEAVAHLPRIARR